MFTILVLIVLPVICGILWFRFGDDKKFTGQVALFVFLIGFIIWSIVRFNINADYENKIAKCSIVKMNGSDYIFGTKDKYDDLMYIVCIKTKNNPKFLTIPADHILIQFTDDRPALIKCWMSATDSKFNKFWPVLKPNKGLVYIIKIPRCKESKK